MSAGPKPGSPEWISIVTASKVGPILGVSPWETPLDIWQHMKAGTWPEANEAMRRGSLLEPAILAWWREEHRADDLVFYWSEQQWYSCDGWIGCTPDGEAELDDGSKLIVEAKSTTSMKGWGRPGTDQIPAVYYAQVLAQLELTGAAECRVAVIGPYFRFSEYIVRPDPEAQARILAACKRFYDSLADDEPPAFITERTAA